MIYDIYLPAAEPAEYGTEVYSTNEMTRLHELEHKYSDKSVHLGNPVLHKFEYIRETVNLIAFLCKLQTTETNRH